MFLESNKFNVSVLYLSHLFNIMEIPTKIHNVDPNKKNPLSVKYGVHIETEFQLKLPYEANITV